MIRCNIISPRCKAKLCPILKKNLEENKTWDSRSIVHRVQSSAYSQTSFATIKTCIYIFIESKRININTYKDCDYRVCFRIWYMGLCWILRGLKRQQQLTDRRSRWLKEKYLQLYFEEGCLEPMTADAIRAFGGRDWSMTESIGTLSPTSSSNLRKRNTKGKKTKSIGNIHALTKVRVLLRNNYILRYPY